MIIISKVLGSCWLPVHADCLEFLLGAIEVHFADFVHILPDIVPVLVVLLYPSCADVVHLVFGLFDQLHLDVLLLHVLERHLLERLLGLLSEVLQLELQHLLLPLLLQVLEVLDLLLLPEAVGLSLGVDLLDPLKSHILHSFFPRLELLSHLLLELVLVLLQLELSFLVVLRLGVVSVHELLLLVFGDFQCILVDFLELLQDHELLKVLGFIAFAGQVLVPVVG